MISFRCYFSGHHRELRRRIDSDGKAFRLFPKLNNGQAWQSLTRATCRFALCSDRFRDYCFGLLLIDIGASCTESRRGGALPNPSGGVGCGRSCATRPQGANVSGDRLERSGMRPGASVLPCYFDVAHSGHSELRASVELRMHSTCNTCLTVEEADHFPFLGTQSEPQTPPFSIPARSKACLCAILPPSSGTGCGQGSEFVFRNPPH